MQRNYTFLACVYGLFVVTMRCITYVAVYNAVGYLFIKRGIVEISYIIKTNYRITYEPAYLAPKN
jgi:uncharacterized membrane protein HdeD (DUF308 family)